MTLAEERRARFNSEFNRMLGDKIGSTRTGYTDASMAPALRNFDPAGKLLDKINADNRRKSGGGSSKATEVGDAFREKQLLELAKTGGTKEDKGLLETVWDGVTDTARRGLDVVSRPAYAVSEGFRNMQESINAGEPIWSLGDDALTGAWDGVSGQKKTGWGDVIEEGTDYESRGKSGWNKLAAGAWFGMPAPGEVIGDMEHTNPEAAKWLKRGLGLAGDIATDPTTYLSAGTAKIAKESIETSLKGGLRAGIKQGTIKTGKEAVQETIDKSIRRSIVDPNFIAQRTPVRSSLGTFTGQSVGAVDALADDVLKQSERLFYEVAGGAQKGKMIGGEEAMSTVAQSAAERWRNVKLSNLDKSTKRFVQGMSGAKPKLTTKQLDTLRLDPVFEGFYNRFVTEMAVSGADIGKAVNVASKTAAEVMEKEATEIFARIHGGLKDEMLNVPTVRLFGQNIAYLPKLGKGISSTGKRLDGTTINKLYKTFSWTSNFPGYSSLISQKARALGNADFETFQRRVFDLAKDTTKADRALIHKSLESGIPLAGPLEQKRLAIRAMYDELFVQEMGNGIRTGAAKNMVPDYTYTYLRGNKKARDQFIAQRSLATKNGQQAQWGVDAARKAGLKPVDDAFSNLLYRKIKSNRQTTRTFFNRDLATHYGIKGVISKDEATRRGLTQLKDADVPEAIRRSLKSNEKLYLDQDIKHVMDNYRELGTVGSDAGEEWARQIDYITRKFKTWNTVYYPGFHIRNMIGDVYMGMLDGVRTSDYSKVSRAWMKKNTADLDIAGETFSFQKIKTLFDENAASGGFQSAELGSNAKRAVEGFTETLKHPSSYAAGVRKFSEHREDFGRFVHFYKALNDEFPAAMRRLKNRDKALAEAVNTATFRVNKYKFDYGALTKFEQKIMRRGVPFYTYMRKAIPTLAEAALMSPRNLSYTNKLYNSMFPENSENFDTMTLPSYIKEGLFAQIPGMGGSEPTGITGSFLPQNVISDLSSNPLASMNPLIKGAFELKSGEDTFTGKPINNIGDVLMNNFRLSGTVSKLNDPKYSGAEKAGTILGIPIVKVSEDRQDQALQELRYKIKGNITALNEEAKDHGLKIFLSEGKAGTIIKIRNYDPKTESNGSIVGEFTSYEEAVAALKSMYG